MDWGTLPKSLIKRTSNVPREEHRKGEGWSVPLPPELRWDLRFFLDNQILSNTMCLWGNVFFCMCVCMCAHAPVFLKSSNVTYIGPHGRGGTTADLNTGVRVSPVLHLGLVRS